MGQIFIRRIINTTERQQDGTSEESSSPSAIDRQTDRQWGCSSEESSGPQGKGGVSNLSLKEQGVFHAIEWLSFHSWDRRQAD